MPARKARVTPKLGGFAAKRRAMQRTLFWLRRNSVFRWFVSFGEAKEMNPSAGRNRHQSTAPQALTIIPINQLSTTTNPTRRL
ncbi:hypothetical protein [Chitinolyticbacter meiyuanensis]|uniref:hypothetical protein n=1 Tax=Chitinolyticbacter meiyuanensis TaxID=682798 RepID=UPI0011E5B4B9|nr:hypothetical protein [Chitinolyticbacter meiyuanensis]